MKIGISAQIQFSLFSSGSGGTSLAVAEAFRNMGHEVWLVNTQNGTEWWDDCPSLKEVWKSFLCSFKQVQEGQFPGDKRPFDMLLEVDKPLFSSAADRAAAASKSVWLIRKSPILHDIEHCLFPLEGGKRCTDGLSAIWCVDLNTSEDDLKYLECLCRVPAAFVPFTWTPSFIEIHRAETKAPTWQQVADTCEPGKPWSIHICETNNSAASSVTVPLTILRHIKKRDSFPVKRYLVHNADHVIRSEFFKQNVKRHCEHPDLSGQYVGRQRVIDWIYDAKSCVLSHMRFMSLRPYLLDAAWTGIPMIHNSLALKDIEGYSRYYYPDNNIQEAEKALQRLNEDFKAKAGLFAADSLAKVRAQILGKFSSYSADICHRWAAQLAALKPVTVSASVPTAMAATAPTPSSPVAKPREFIVAFSDMWDDFNPEYNMFTLLLNEAGRHMNPPVRVIGQYIGSQKPNVLIFGPFGDTWKTVDSSVPKVHYTGENSGLIVRQDIRLNIGYQHADFADQEYLRIPLWMFEIDWFGADKDRIVNPKPLPIDRCTQVYPEDLARKKKFCAFVVTNPCNEVRNNSFHWLSQYKSVDSAGRLFNNVGDALFAGRGGGGGELKKFEFLRDYKFCLAYENSSSQGYTTEKLLHAKAAGCIPIYWGDPKVDRDFDSAGFINAQFFSRPEQLIEAVREIDSSPSAWLKKYSVPALDDTRRDLVRRTLSECARRIWKLVLGKEEGLDAIPRFLGAANDKEAAELAQMREQKVAPVAAMAQEVLTTTAIAVAAKPSRLLTGPTKKSAISTILVATAATRRFLPSLHQWIISIQAQKRDPSIQVESDIWLGDDIEETTANELHENFPWVRFHRFPKDVSVADFSDLWEPQHFAWKLWILRELSINEIHLGKMVLYLDSGIFMCRWPTDWLYLAKEHGLCVLEDPRQLNQQWCHADFCAALGVTAEEKAEQQIWAGAIAFEAGSRLASQIFEEAWKWGQIRKVIMGPKWEGMRDGKPYGHRHDQSILSILTGRANVPRYPMDLLYCSESLRRTFMTRKAFYVHRGGFTVHKNFSDAIDDCYVINLDRRADRMEKLYANMPDLRDRVQRVSAIEGRKLQMTPAIARLFRPHDFNWKKPVLGCALSHLGIWWQLANERDDINSYLIFEDDVKLAEGWEARWKEAVPHIPEGFDVIYLGGILPPNRAAFEKSKEKINSHFSRVAENSVFGQQPPNRYFHWCAYAYVLSKQGARKILEILKARDGYWTSADHMICNPVNILQMYFLDPLVAGCYQDEDPRYQNAAFNDFSRVDGFDSDLWNNNECFVKEEADALAKMNLPLDIPAALADAKQILEVVTTGPTQVEAKKDIPQGGETTLGKESPDTAKQQLTALLHETADPKWREFFLALAKGDSYAARAMAFDMVQNWSADWQTRPREDFEKLGAALSAKHLSDLPNKDTLQNMLQKFIFTTDSLENKDLLTPIREALTGLIGFNHVIVPAPQKKGRRLLALKEQDLRIGDMFEKLWLQDLFGWDFNLHIDSYTPGEAPPTDEPILVLMRPYVEAWCDALKSWEAQNIKYYILHLSDEHRTDPIHMYRSPNCLGVVRMYHREDAASLGEKVVTIPLGYHWTKSRGIEDPVEKTPRLPFRELVWSFLGTAWNDRPEKMKNLQLLQPHKLVWFKEWRDASMLGQDEYMNILLNSKFVPAPGGVNAETYRFYEALECGAVPVYVRQEGDDNFIQILRGRIPIADLPSWDHAAAFMYELSNNVAVLESYRNNCLVAWREWKKAAAKSVRETLKISV